MNIRTSKFKTVFGIVLVLVAVGALFFWEAEGREMLLMDDVLVAEEDIKAGNEIDTNNIRIVSAPSGTLVDSALSPDDIALLDGKIASTDIIKGSQLSSHYLREKDETPKPDTSYFIIRNEWISMCTSSLRRGDEIQIVSADTRTPFGQFRVIYVKDGDGREVTDASAGISGFTGGTAESDRVNTSSPIHHIEIECELSEYRRILDYCSGKAFAPLMLIRKEVE